MTVEIPVWAALAVAVLIAVDVLSWVLLRRERFRRREAELRLERLTARRARVAPVVASAVVQPESVAMPVTLVQQKVSGSEVGLPPRGAGVTWDDHDAAVATARTELAGVVTEIRDRAAEVEAARVAEVMASNEYLAYVMSTEPVRRPGELDQWQQLEVLAAHGRERPEPPPPIQPEPVVAETVTEVLEPVDVDDPPQGGRALTPFEVEGPPPGLPYRHVWAPQPSPWPAWKGVLPNDIGRRALVEVTRLGRELRRRGPIEVRRITDPAERLMDRVRADVAQRRVEWGREPGSHRRSGYIGDHRLVA